MNSPDYERHIRTESEMGASPWTFRMKCYLFIWQLTWFFLCAWTPKPANSWRVFVLKCFGCKVYGKPFVHQSARIQIPWNLTMHHKSCLGDGATAYSLGPIELLPFSTVAQEAYLCTGTHDFSHVAYPLITNKITIGLRAFVGARAFIFPGIVIGSHAIVGACSVVTKNVAENAVVAGNPAKLIYVKNL